MPDETQQLTPEPTQPEPISTPPVENPISEPNPVPVSPQEPIPDASIPSTDSTSPEMPSEALEAPPSPESAVVDKDQNPANEPLNPQNEPILESPPTTLENKPEIIIEPANQNITIEKSGDKVTITEVMQPTAQMAGNEPLAEKRSDFAKATPDREENLKIANETRQNKKREKIEKILNLFNERQTVTNDEVEKLLHVSDATATRYLETLEKEGKIKQVGKTGKHTHYEKI